MASQELTHFGVKGMKWGHHKARDLVPSKQQVQKAAVTTGKTVAKASVATAKAVGKSASYVAHHRRMAVGALVAADILVAAGRLAVGYGKAGILVKAANNRKTAYEAGRFAVKALSSTAAKVNYAKVVRGAYKITTM